MKKKQLLIGIPTKGHPKYIQYYLSSILPDAKKYNIDVGIYDSSSTDDTQKIVEKSKGGGYTNLFYKKYPEDIPYWKKLKDIFIGSGYEYVWLCGDGVVICIDRCINALEEEFVDGRDFIIFGKGGQMECMELDEPLELAKNCWGAMGFYGNFIIRGNLLGLREWENYEEKYKDWLHIGACLEKFANHEFRAKCINYNFSKINPYKKYSTWVGEGRMFSVMENWIHAIEALPDIYQPVKPVMINSFIENYSKLEFLWLWRMDGNLNYSIALKHIKLVMKYRGIQCIKVFIVSLCPKKIADLICTVNGSKSQVYKR